MTRSEAPSAVEIEQAVIGAMLTNPAAGIPRCRGLLQEKDYYDERHSILHAAIMAVSDRGEGVDQLTVGEELKRGGKLERVGGVVYLASLAAGVAGAANIQHHARIIANTSQVRTELEDHQREIQRLIATGEPANAVARGRRKLLLTDAASIKPRPVHWLWEDNGSGRIPLAEVSLTPGEGGIGKSLFHCWFVARVSLGQLPGAYMGKPRGCMIVATEDSWAQTIVPRLMAQGADLKLVFRADMEEVGNSSARLTLPSDLDALGDAIESHEVSLVSLDPLMTLIDARLDSWKDSEIRRALEPLKKLAEESGCTILGNAHFNKATSSDPMSRITGSAAIGQVVRAVLAFARDDQASTCVISQAKNNLGKLDLPSLAYRVESKEIPTEEGPAEVGQLVFCGEAARSVREVMQSHAGHHPDAPARSEAESFLRDVLRDGPRSASAVNLEAAEADITPSALRKARERICRVFKAGMDEGWRWELLPEGDPQETEVAPRWVGDSFSVFEDDSPGTPSRPCDSCGGTECWTDKQGGHICTTCRPRTIEAAG